MCDITERKKKDDLMIHEEAEAGNPLPANPIDFMGNTNQHSF